VGGGNDAESGKTLTVNYTGWLYDASKPDKKGRVFDSSIGKAPFSFVLGQGQVIPGWEKGVEGMKVGGLRRLIVPPSLAYGSAGAGDVIPPDTILVFDVELLRVN
jgi:FKBP-type peptidyl-prolyl cis-trans isomerase FkpA